jgi:hypothetical protein
MDEQSHLVPYEIEDPIPILFWNPIEFILALMFAGFGVIVHLWIVGMAGAAAVLIGSRYLKRGAKRGAMQHFLWKHGLQVDSHLKTYFPPSWVNDFTR